VRGECRTQKRRPAGPVKKARRGRNGMGRGREWGN
jgi:hypothetical protein